MTFIENVREISGKIGEKISEVFDGTKLNDLAKKVGFVKRSTSRIEGEDFVRLMTTEILGEETVSTEGLCDILRQINPKADMTPQSLNERINKKEAAEYMKKVFESAFRKNLEPVTSEISPDLLSPFGRVFLEDSTQVALHEKLADDFKGSGGSAGKSALKIDLTYEVKQDILHKILISGGSTNDQSRAEEIPAEIQENDLILRDLGYFSLKSLEKVGKKGAFFLSRLPRGVNVYLSDDDDASPVSLPEYLDKKFAYLPVIEVYVYLGQQKLFCRLIAYRVPDETVNERQRKAHRNGRKKGRQPSKDYLNLLRFSFFVTNVPSEIWEPEVVGTVYRLRWQIELTFKTWKSLLNIHVLRGTRRERIECFLFGRLTAAVIMTMIFSYASWYAYNYLKKEASAHKLIDWLKRKDRLAKTIRSGCPEALSTDYSAELRRLKDAGTIIESGEDNWHITQQAFLWWLADEIKRITRDESSRDESGFEAWICEQEMDGLLTKQERKNMSQAVSEIATKGATTLIESFAKGFGTGS
ncbi:MAG: IS4 family transposase [Desulfobacterales bacterium]|nr:IS4 family transposase [Desulfobacterales bacterium]